MPERARTDQWEPRGSNPLGRPGSFPSRPRFRPRVGDLFMSLIYTCQLNEANPFDYLTQLQRHADRLATNPQLWMPWNYREALA